MHEDILVVLTQKKNCNLAISKIEQKFNLIFHLVFSNLLVTNWANTVTFEIGTRERNNWGFWKVTHRQGTVSNFVKNSLVPELFSVCVFTQTYRHGLLQHFSRTMWATRSFSYNWIENWISIVQVKHDWEIVGSFDAKSEICIWYIFRCKVWQFFYPVFVHFPGSNRTTALIFASLEKE